MAPLVNYSTAAFTLILILLISPVTADASGSLGGVSNQPATVTTDYTIQLFSPTASMIHSDQIKDLINGPWGNEVLIATSFGLSSYNGSWETRHANLNNVSAGLLDDYITAMEYDADGNLWLGYSGGIQIFNGRYYQTIRDQQLLKDPRINDLQRWNNDIWIATGNSGIHRVHKGTWTWFQPMTETGPGFYEIDSMVVDPATNALVIATTKEGLWIIRSPEEPIRFEQLAGKNTIYGSMDHVRKDPMGGVYFFDQSSVAHYGADAGFAPVLTTSDLSKSAVMINDISAGPDGKLYIASDDGLFIWKNGKIYRHLTRFEGIGTSSAVRTVNVDALNRVWFSTKETIGYYIDTTEPDNLIQIVLVTPGPDSSLVQTTSPGGIISPGSPLSPSSSRPLPETVNGSGKGSVFDPITGFINAISGVFGIKLFS
ncbi:two-component regulator propeller domain-containing protein [Methanoregula sp.]|uniref:two-component regulator propeller domain-containing protein n=1 Tax=Methanoregula sp. TaxID=2052170 RepID=UPI003561D5C1